MKTLTTSTWILFCVAATTLIVGACDDVLRDEAPPVVQNVALNTATDVALMTRLNTCTTVAATATLGMCKDNGCQRSGGVCTAVDVNNDGTWDECQCKKKPVLSTACTDATCPTH